MSIIRIKHRGNFNNIERFLNKMIRRDYLNDLAEYGERGVAALKSATPVKSGKTADSWYYEIESNNRDNTTIVWKNSNVNKKVTIALILEYGHGTKNGAYVKGLNYVDPAIHPVFENLAEDVWREVINS